MNSFFALALLLWFGLTVIIAGFLRRTNTSHLVSSSWRLGWLVLIAFVLGIFLTLMLYYQP